MPLFPGVIPKRGLGHGVQGDGSSVQPEQGNPDITRISASRAHLSSPGGDCKVVVGGKDRKCQTEACVLLGKAKAAVGNHTLSGARIPTPGQGPIAKSDFPSPHLPPMRKTNETFSFLTWAAPPACLVTLPSSIPHSQPLPLSVIHKPSAAPTFLCLQVAGAGAAGEKPAP